MVKETDSVDKKILELLFENPELSQADISKSLGISQPAVSARIRRLKDVGVLTFLVGTEIRKSQLFLARIDIVTTDTESVVKLFDKCPLYLNGFLTSGRYNLSMLLIGENIRSLMACANSHLGKDPIIKKMEFNIIVAPTKDLVIPLKPILSKKKLSACERDCSICVFYTNGRCLGCPASTCYKGKLL